MREYFPIPEIIDKETRRERFTPFCLWQNFDQGQSRGKSKLVSQRWNDDSEISRGTKDIAAILVTSHVSANEIQLTDSADCRVGVNWI